MKKYSFVFLFYLMIILFFKYSYCQIVNGSFETEDGQFSLVGWENHGGIPYSEAPSGGGQWSLEISGGCIWSYCTQYIPEIRNGDIWELKCWAKRINIISGGHIYWSIEEYIQNFISDTVWTQMCVVDTFQLEEQDSVYLILEGGGGIVGFGGAYFDLVEIKKIGNISSIIGRTDQKLSKSFNLDQNYPNPFNPKTTISFTLSQTSHIKLKIFNIAGQEIATIAEGLHSTGRYEFNWSVDAHVASGIYFCQLHVYDVQGSELKFIETRQLILQK